MKNRTLQVILLAVAGVAATAHCGKGESTVTPPLGPTDVVVTWTFDGKPASAAECMNRGGLVMNITLNATNDPALHQNATAACDAGTLTFAGLDTGGLGMPLLEGALLDDKGVTVKRAETTVVPTAGKTAVTLDFFPSGTTAASTSGDPATTSGDPATSSASSGGGGMGGMGGASASSAASTAASTSAASSAAATTAGAGGAGGGP